MENDTSFGTDPENLRRLFALGTSEPDKEELTEQIDSWDLMKEKPGTQVGRYRLLDILGEGGMGIVYLAEQEHPVKRQVALKVIKPGMDSRRIVARFEAERQTLAWLDHPNIAHVLDGGRTEAGRPYFVMEYVKGLAITEHCDQHRLSIDERLTLFGHVCDAIQHAHEKGVIHRDIKPSNILVAVEGSTPIPKIIDFGVARALSQHLTNHTLLTEEGQFVGTPEYMSPEQISLAAESVDVRSDVYSLGVLLYTLLTGVLPFDSEALRRGGLDTFRQVITQEDPKTPSKRLGLLGEQGKHIAKNRRTELVALTRYLRRELEWIPLRAMAKDPQKRYHSAAELGDDIRNYLIGAPLIAGPPGRFYRIKKFVKRNRAAVAAAILVTLTLATGALVSLTMHIRARIQAERTEAVSDFLTNKVLSALSPLRPQGGEITALSVLNAISGSIEGRFQDAPLVEAGVRHALGASYIDHSEIGPAVEQLETALNIRRKKLGENDALTLASMLQLGLAYYGQGRHAEAEPLLSHVVAQQKQHFAVESNSRLSAMRVLGWNYEAMEEYDQAIRLYEECLKIARSTVGDTHVSTGTALYSIGCGNLVQNRYEEAQKWFEKALQLARQNYGEDHGLLADFTSCLGLAHLLQGHYSQAEPLLKESVVRFRRVRGNTDWLTLQSLGRLICLYRNWGKPDEARKWQEKLETTRSEDSRGLLCTLRHDQAGNTYVMQSSGFDIWDLFDNFHFAHKTLTGDGSITARIDSMEKVHTWTKVGIMMRRTLEATSEHVSVFITPYGVVSSNRRSTDCGITLHRSGGMKPVGFPHWIRLTRRANTFTAEHSSDGVRWERVHSGDPNRAGPIEILMDDTVHIGLALASHDITRIAEAHISNVALTGSVAPKGPFAVSQDIGAGTMSPSTEDDAHIALPDPNKIGAPDDSGKSHQRLTATERGEADVKALISQYGHSVGSIKYQESTNTYTVVGCGRDIFQMSDEFHFAHKTLEGDGFAAMRIDYVEPVHLWTKAGVMIRDTLTADSAHASVFITPVRRVCLQYRSAAGQETLTLHTDPNAVTLPHWVKLIRAGNTFRAQHSDDGKRWKDLEGTDSVQPATHTWPAVVTIPMGNTVYVGLAVTSHAGPVPAEARMSHITVAGDVSPPGEFLWSEDIGFQMIMLPKK